VSDLIFWHEQGAALASMPPSAIVRPDCGFRIAECGFLPPKALAEAIRNPNSAIRNKALPYLYKTVVCMPQETLPERNVAHAALLPPVSFAIGSAG
jgi:hypothetical protein